MKQEKTRSERVALLGLFAALAVVLSALESALPPLPVPGARFGLANLAVTAALWWLGAPAGASVAAAKVLFVLLMRGATAALLALGGTAAAFLVMIALLPLCRKEKLTFVGVSISAAAAHTAGQLGVASMWIGAAATAVAPWMLWISILSGAVTGLVLNVAVPRLTMLGTRSKGCDV
ncbi:MAG: Gx transporter family protein [Clostridia bacterium]|nr:Gx transporter family protein [Clostridia bacterium]